MSRRLLAIALLAAGCAGSPDQTVRAAVTLAPQPPTDDASKTAKALWVDRKYAEARAAWQAVLKASSGAESEEALYYIGRSSEALGELERAFGEYGAFLERHPSKVELRDEALTFRIGIAAKLYKKGQKEHLSVITEALASGSKTVRYFAALQLSGLPPDVGRQAIPVLREILTQETDSDLVDRAKLGMLRLDPTALGHDGGPSGAKKATWLRLRISKTGKAKPEVSINVPVAFAELLFKSLPDDARQELRKQGYDADNFWARLKALGPTSVVHIEGEDGEKIDIWLE